MSNAVDGSEITEELRAKLDELVTDLLLNGPSQNFCTDLRDYRELADRVGRPELAASASHLLEEAKHDEQGNSDERLRKGLAELQRALAQSDTDGGCAQEQSDYAASTNLNALAQDPELVGDFVTESREHLAAVENGMLVLDENPNDTEAIHAVFRGFHTIKGLAGFLEFIPIRDVAHEVETLLGLARNSRLAITKRIVDVVLESVDYLTQAIGAVAVSPAGTQLALRENRDLLLRIQGLIASKANSEEESGESLAQLSHDLTSDARENASAAKAEETQPVQTDFAVTNVGKNRAKASESFSVRVQTAKLDYLMDMVGEMVITQSLIGHNPAFAAVRDAKLLADLSQLARITTEVQRATMGMRMITIGQVFQRTTRMVRDLSRKCQKPVELEISGEDTELDKTIAEELADPLLHMVRNAVDHGIEPPEMRAATGKSATARIKLAAYHQSGQIVVEISDDGRGLDRDKILSKARQKALIGDEVSLPENEIYNLIFEPGFSTAAVITDLSGRGVGMDVVRKNIQKLRGRIDIETKAGEGTTFFLRLPLTLAIIEGLVVGVAGQRFIVPICAVRELISPKGESISTVQGSNEVAMVRDRVLPVLRLAKRFDLPARENESAQKLMIITECREQLFALLVDEVLGKQEVVIKSLGEDLRNISGIAGGAILGDGRIGLILDLEGVFRGGKQ